MQPPPDQAQRDEALNPNASFIVQAPAGSGKTTLLVERYLTLLQYVARPEEILAITFTRKAAQEMRSRVLLTLQGDTPLARAIRERDQKLGWQLELTPYRLKIQTIDSFALDLATQLPSAATAAGMDIAEEPEEYYAAAAQQLLGRLYADDETAGIIAEFLRIVDNNPQTASALLVRMLSKRDQWLGLTNDLSGLAAQPAFPIITLIETAIAELHQAITTPLIEALTEADQAKLIWLAEQTGRQPELSDIAPLLLTAKGQFRKTLTRREHEAFADKTLKTTVLAWLQDLHARELADDFAMLLKLPPKQLEDTAADNLLCVALTLSLAAAELESVMYAARQIDFTGILMRAARSLRDEAGPTDIALHWDYRIRHILVDEFQDTSQSQYRFFQLLTENWSGDAANTFFAVGDPMQSIYRFRDAEVSLFGRCRTQGLGDLPLTPLTLTANFRSQKTLVQWNNELFSKLFGQGGMTHLGAIPFAPASAIHAGSATVSCLAFTATEAEIRGIVDHIRSLRSTEPDCHIGVLCRARNHLPPLLRALQNAEITWQATDIDPLHELPEVRDLITLLKVLLTPLDRLAWFSLLRSPLIGLPLTQLEQFQDTADLQAILPAIAATDPRLARLNAALNWAHTRLYEVSLREVIEGFWFRLGGMDAYSAEALQNCFNWLQSLDQHGPRGYDIDYVNRATRRLYAQPTTANETTGRLDVMTIHRSKGLQFDHVIVPFTERDPRGDGSDLLLWQTSLEGQNDTLLAGVRGDPVHQWLKHENAIRSANEHKRLLYVACTRAIKSLWLSFSCVICPEVPAPAALSPPPRGLARLFFSEAEFAPISDVPETTALAYAQIPAKQTLSRLPADYRWQPPAYAPAAIAAPARATKTDLIGARLEVALGNLVHRTLAWLGHEHPAELSQLDQRLAQWSRQLPIAAEQARLLCEQARTHIHSTWQSETGQWILQPKTFERCEWSLTHADARGFATSVLDRCFIEDNICWIIDYKTSTPDEGQPLRGFLQHEAQRYQQQLDRYREIAGYLPELASCAEVRTALFFTGSATLHLVV